MHFGKLNNIVDHYILVLLFDSKLSSLCRLEMARIFGNIMHKLFISMEYQIHVLSTSIYLGYVPSIDIFIHLWSFGWMATLQLLTM